MFAVLDFDCLVVRNQLEFLTQAPRQVEVRWDPRSLFDLQPGNMIGIKLDLPCVILGEFHENMDYRGGAYSIHLFFLSFGLDPITGANQPASIGAFVTCPLLFSAGWTATFAVI
jgi:hypothetical protein